MGSPTFGNFFEGQMLILLASSTPWSTNQQLQMKLSPFKVLLGSGETGKVFCPVNSVQSKESGGFITSGLRLMIPGQYIWRNVLTGWKNRCQLGREEQLPLMPRNSQKRLSPLALHLSGSNICTGMSVHTLDLHTRMNCVQRQQRSRQSIDCCKVT